MDFYPELRIISHIPTYDVTFVSHKFLMISLAVLTVIEYTPDRGVDLVASKTQD